MGFNLASGLEGKGVLVTGAAGGIGREVARAFAAAGSRVAAIDLKQEAVDAVIAECEGGPIRVNLINPGPMRTAMRRKAMPGEDPDTLPTPEDMAYKVVEILSPSWDSNETIIHFKK